MCRCISPMTLLAFSVQGEPWCFYGVKECLDVHPKVDCGELYITHMRPGITTACIILVCLLLVVGECGIPRNDCEDKGCCWVESETVKSCHAVKVTLLTDMWKDNLL